MKLASCDPFPICREVIANISLGSGAWALANYVAASVPWGLSIGYVLTTWLLQAWFNRFPLPLNSRLL